MTWWISATFTALLVVTVVGVSWYFLPALFVPYEEPDFTDVDELARADRKFSPGQPAGDAGTGRVPPTRLAETRPGQSKGKE